MIRKKPQRKKPLKYKSHNKRKNYVTNTNRVNKKITRVSNPKVINGDDNYTDGRACPDCCVALCNGQSAGQCSATCYSDGSIDFGCNCAGQAAPSGGYQQAEQSLAASCANGGWSGGPYTTIPCYCSYNYNYCNYELNCSMGSCNSSHEPNPPAVCPDEMFDDQGNYIPQYTAGGMAIHIPGCEEWAHGNAARRGN